MDMDNMWEKIKKGLKDGAVMSVEKIEELTKIGKLKVDELAAKRKIERNFLDIGERFYDLAQDAREASAPSDLVIAKAIENVRSLYAEVAEIGEKIREIQKAAKKGDADDSYADDSGV
ncbi:MAG: hypothetical protein FWB85_09145 [Chitinispirillia bacterium]|nr:hypothetical protein [Chitinispirillia bacterium]MCL2242370.1 hypothetical protein [Chitinispirillia bacterium]